MKQFPEHARLRAGRLALLSGLLAAATAWAEAPQPLTGTLTKERGVQVLRLHGNAYQRGYTHGYLLGPEIRRMAAELLLSRELWPDLQQYEGVVRQQLVPAFTFTAEQTRELEGMLAGLRERLGAGSMRIQSVGREIDLIDLKAANVYADLQNVGCTTFAAWGPATRDRGMIVARNLDFPRYPVLADSPLIIVQDPTPAGARGWVSVSWPAMIGGYTVMNADGVFAAMHDVRAPTDPTAAPFVPRSLALRAIVESCGAQETIPQATEILRARSAYCGNNFLVAAPFEGQALPAAVFEYDSRRSLDGGVSLRTCASRESGLPDHTLACTNHHRLRGGAEACTRYATIHRALKRHPTSEVDAAFALEVQRGAAMPMTLHTVVAELNQRALTVYFCTPDKPAPESEGVRFTLDELFGSAKADVSGN